MGEDRLRQLVGGGLDQPGDVVEDLPGAALMVGPGRRHELSHRGERRTVPRQHDLWIEGDEPIEGIEVLDQAAASQQVTVAVGLDERIRGDRRQQVIAGKQP